MKVGAPLTTIRPRKIHLLIAFMLLSGLLLSCSSSKDTVIRWNVELKEAELPITDRCDPDKKLSSVKSPETPLVIPATEDREGRIRIVGVPCSKGEEPPVYEIPLSRVKRVTYVSDPISPPEEKSVQDLEMLTGCCTTRDGWWIFDKVEIRGLLGFRGTEDSVVYPGNPTPTVYKSSLFGFGRGGSTLFTGLEASGLWNAYFIDESGKLQMGVVTGVWPVDGSAFVPLGLHMRYTFNNHPPKYSQNCNSWYLYGMLGLPLDFETGAPIFADSFTYQRYFYGLGIGHDWALTCEMDFSVDLGIRGMNLPLPPFECCPSTPDDSKYPYRNSLAVLLRLGLTF